jgi:hypothetical protein
MKLYAETNRIDSDWVDIYYHWNGKPAMFASVCSDQLDTDLQERLVEAEEAFRPLTLELS